MFVCLPIRYFIVNDDNNGVVKCQKNPTTPPRCHSDQVDPLVLSDGHKYNFPSDGEKVTVVELE